MVTGVGVMFGLERRTQGRMGHSTTFSALSETVNERPMRGHVFSREVQR